MPVVVNDEIAIRLMLPLSISYDHRLGEGAAAARFLNDMIGYRKRLLMMSENAPGLSRGSLRSSLQSGTALNLMPWACPVVAHAPQL